MKIRKLLMPIVLLALLLCAICMVGCNHEHEWGEWALTEEPTCTEVGVETRTCECGEKETRDIAVLGHDEVPHEEQDPTCTEVGWEAHVTCSRCDYTTYVEIPAKGHLTVTHQAKAPTCLGIGWDKFVDCVRCDYTTYVEKAALGHDEIPHAAQAPTCLDIGWDAYDTCSRCDYTTYVEKGALGHDEITHAAQAPTCLDIGWNAYDTCSRCSYTTYAELPALGHDEVEHDAKSATCTEIGWNAYVTCERCSYTTYKEISAGHTAGYTQQTNYVAATCTSNGSYTNVTYCGVCDEEMYRNTYTTSKLSHSWIAATCTSPKKCSNCGTTTGSKLSHEGVRSCSTCGYNAFDDFAALIKSKGTYTYDSDGSYYKLTYRETVNYKTLMYADYFYYPGSNKITLQIRMLQYTSSSLSTLSLSHMVSFNLYRDTSTRYSFGSVTAGSGIAVIGSGSFSASNFSSSTSYLYMSTVSPSGVSSSLKSEIEELNALAMDTLLTYTNLFFALYAPEIDMSTFGFTYYSN